MLINHSRGISKTRAVSRVSPITRARERLSRTEFRIAPSITGRTASHPRVALLPADRFKRVSAWSWKRITARRCLSRERNRDVWQMAQSRRALGAIIHKRIILKKKKRRYSRYFVPRGPVRKVGYSRNFERAERVPRSGSEVLFPARCYYLLPKCAIGEGNEWGALKMIPRLVKHRRVKYPRYYRRSPPPPIVKQLEQLSLTAPFNPSLHALSVTFH